MVPQTISMVRAAEVTAFPRERGSAGALSGEYGGAALRSPAANPAISPPPSTETSTHAPAMGDPSHPPTVPRRNMGLMVAQAAAARRQARPSAGGCMASSRAPAGEPPHQPSTTTSQGGIRPCMRLTSICDRTM